MMKENVNHPKHYTECSLSIEDKKKIFCESLGKDYTEFFNLDNIECIEFMRITFGNYALYNFCIMNAIKYMWRCDFKSSKKEDLNKAKWYLDKASSLWTNPRNNIVEVLKEMLKEN